MVRCSAHPATFEVMFARPAVVAAPTPQPDAPPVPVPLAALPRGEPAGSEDPDRIVVECPSCSRRYKVKRTDAGAKAHCKCGYELVIEDQERLPETAGGGVSPGPAGKCVQHPNLDAVYACGRCHKLICDTCAFPQVDGSFICPECATIPDGQAVPMPVAAAPAVPLADGAVCVRHAEVPANRRCSQCNAAVCTTCDFAFPGGIHLCPSCATTPQTRLSGKQKTYAGWSLGLAVWSTLGTALVLTGALADTVTSEADEEALGVVLMLLVVFPSLIGLALGISSFERGMKSPPLVWVGTIWSGVVLGVWLLLIIVGLTMS